MYHSQIVIQAYAKVVEAAVTKYAAEQKKAGWAIALTAASAVIGSRSSSAYGTIASLGATGAGVGVAVDAFSNMSDLKQVVSVVLQKSDEVRSGVVKNVDTSRQEYLAFDGFVQEVIKNIQLVLNPPKAESSISFSKLTKAIPSSLRSDTPDTLTNNKFNNAAKTIKAIGGLFKKKD
jgi:hypothetical protein